MARKWYKEWKEADLNLRAQEKKTIGSIRKDTGKTDKRIEGDLKETKSYFRLQRARLHKHMGRGYWKELTGHMSSCNCFVNESIDNPVRFNDLSVIQVWSNLIEYRERVGRGKCRDYILGRLACAGVPFERDLRAQKTYDTYGVRMYFHSLLAVFGIPLNTAQQKLYVLQDGDGAFWFM